MTIYELCTEWLNDYHKDQVKRQTYIKYQCLIENYVKDDIGQADIYAIKKKDLQEYMNRLKSSNGKRTGRPLSASTINETLTLLKMAFDYARDFDILEYSPVERVKGAKKVFKKGVKCFTIEEQTAIERYVYEKDYSWYGIVLCLYTGLRLGELLALTWEDVDFYNGIMSVNKTVYSTRDENGNWARMVDTPKTQSSYREIPLPYHIVVTLRKMKEAGNSSYIISHSDGSCMPGRTYRLRYNTMLEKLNIPHINFHCLRHTFATRAIEYGMDVKTLSEILGHANPMVTLNVYTHSMSEHKKQSMQLMKPLVKCDK